MYESRRNRRRDSILRARLIALFVALAALTVSLPVYAAPTVLVFGDSLSAGYGLARDAGWVALLERRLAERDTPVRVVNASVSGETTAGGRARLEGELARTEPDIVILELGGNDGLRALPVADMQTNLAAMIAASRAAGARVLLLGMRIPANYGKRYSEQFHRAFEQTADKQDVAYVPFFLAPIANDRANFQDDGIHPNAEAQPAMLDAVWPTLKPLIDQTLSQTPAAG
ncbi:arylesterase [Salinisphaera sp. T31B1]|uniref:arylesterase n=1 Tax=Salinisphaera sp. T31B1 TaxID=727963 RepID=UPI00333FBF36